MNWGSWVMGTGLRPRWWRRVLDANWSEPEGPGCSEQHRLDLRHSLRSLGIERAPHRGSAAVHRARRIEQALSPVRRSLTRWQTPLQLLAAWFSLKATTEDGYASPVDLHQVQAAMTHLRRHPLMQQSPQGSGIHLD